MYVHFSFFRFPFSSLFRYGQNVKVSKLHQSFPVVTRVILLIPAAEKSVI
jgi:hypothetical protein